MCSPLGNVCPLTLSHPFSLTFLYKAFNNIFISSCVSSWLSFCCVIWLQSTGSHPSLVKVEVWLNICHSILKPLIPFSFLVFCWVPERGLRAPTLMNEYEYWPQSTWKFVTLLHRLILLAIHLSKEILETNGRQSLNTLEKLISNLNLIVFNVKEKYFWTFC